VNRRHSDLPTTHPWRQSLARAAFVGLIVVAPTAGAQSLLWFRGRPLPTCQSFVLFELTGAKRLVGTRQLDRRPYSQTQTYVEDLGDYLSWTLGAMSNLDSVHAVGGLLDVGYGDGWRVAIKARRRTWISRESSLDVSAGPEDKHAPLSMADFA
jgi:hypothetical protein